MFLFMMLNRLSETHLAIIVFQINTTHKWWMGDWKAWHFKTTLLDFLEYIKKNVYQKIVYSSKQPQILHVYEQMMKPKK